MILRKGMHDLQVNRIINLLFYRIPVVLVGNKTDLGSDRKVRTEEGKNLAQSWNAIFLETSAKVNLVSCHQMLCSDKI